MSEELPDEIDGVDVKGTLGSLSMLLCPWRLRTGICESGCQSEPACETMEPDDGWAGELRRAVGEAPDGRVLAMDRQRRANSDKSPEAGV